MELIYDAAGNLKQIKRQAPYGLGVTGFAPASGPVGTTVTIYGFGFSTTAANNTVTFNGTPATVAIADIGSLSVTVPSGATSGAISVAVGGLSSSSARPFTVLTTGLPPGYLEADIETKVRLADGGAPGVVEVGTVNHHAAILFDLAADRYYTLQFGLFGTSPINSRVDYKVFDPSNVEIKSGIFGDTWGRPTIHLPKTATAGTYTVMVSPGIATFTAQASLAADPVLVVDGAMANVTTTGRWQSTRNIFNATAGQRLGLGISGLVMTPSSSNPLPFRIYQPNGTELPSSLTSCYSLAAYSAQGNCDGEFVATSAGTYVMIVETFYPIQPSYGIQLSSEHTSTLLADTAANVALTRLGQDGKYTFSAAAGDSIGVELSAVTPAGESKPFNLAILRPNGTQLTSTSASAGTPSYLELGTLSTAGDYSFLVDPSYAAYGTAKLKVLAGTTLDTTSAPTSFSTSNVGDSVRFRFAGTSGQSGLTLGIKTLAYSGGSSSNPANVYVYRPDGSSLASAGCYPTSVEGRCKITLPNLPSTGTYSVRISPPANVQTSGTIALSAEITGSLTAGTPTAFSITRQGQGARYSFSGTAGQSTSIEISQFTTTPSQTMYAYVYKPDGNYLGGSSANSNGIYVNLQSLPTTGTYSVTLDPYLGVAASGNITLEPGTAVTVNGSTQAIATSVAGETVRYTFSGTAGTRLEMGVSGLGYSLTSASPTTIYLWGPDGYTATGLSCSVPPGACEGVVASLALTGNYAITVQPPTGVVLTSGSLAVSTPATGSLTIGGSSQSVSLSRPGQTARLTFSGTSAQLLRLSWANPSVTGGSSVPVTILKPDGSTLSSLSYAATASGFDIPSLPTTGTYTIVVDPAAAVTTSVDLTLVTRP